MAPFNVTFDAAQPAVVIVLPGAGPAVGSWKNRRPCDAVAEGWSRPAPAPVSDMVAPQALLVSMLIPPTGFPGGAVRTKVTPVPVIFELPVNPMMLKPPPST